MTQSLNQISKNDVNQLIKNTADVRSVLNSKTVFQPFNENTLNFLQHLSNELLQNPLFKRNPALASLGFWLRKANIVSLSKTLNVSIHKARGLTFHICPSNVETMFIYSWVLSLLMGNRNIIRLSSSRSTTDLTSLLKLINQALGLPQYADIALSTCIITYPHSEQITTALSLACDTRIIWGGDRSIEAVRQSPLKPTGLDVVFSDRESGFLIKSNHFNNLNSEDRASLYRKIHNDSYTFAQKACSSPRTFFWVGTENDFNQSHKLFWSEFNNYVKTQPNNVPLSMASEKLAFSQIVSMTSSDSVEFVDYANMLTTSVVTHNYQDTHCGAFPGGGFFYNMNLPQLSDLAQYINDKMQTCTYLGFTKEEILAFCQSSKNSFDRWVPVGKALDFNYVWDGYDILRSVSKQISIQ